MSDSSQPDGRPDDRRSSHPAGGRPTGGRPDGGRRDDARPAKGKPASGKPSGTGREGAPGKPPWSRESRDAAEKKPWSRDGAGKAPGAGEKKPWSRDGAGPRDGAGRGAGEKRLWTRDGKPARGDRDASAREPEEDRDPFGTRSVRPRHDDPVIPDDVQAGDLDRVARNELKTLSKDNAEGVARHLVMAARLIDEDPQLAHAHATSAARRAGRIGVVRETLAITAYAIEDFGLALRELRTYRRITGRDDELPMMVDCERALGRPEKALELGRSVSRDSLPVPVQVELAIAMSGARLDLGQAELALQELRISQLDPDRAYSWSPPLFDAYAEVLEELGRGDEASQWRTRAEVAAAAVGADDEDDEVIVVEEDIADVNMGDTEVENAQVVEEARSGEGAPDSTHDDEDVDD